MHLRGMLTALAAKFIFDIILIVRASATTSAIDPTLVVRDYIGSIIVLHF